MVTSALHADQHDMLVEVLPVDEYDRPPARIKSYVELEQPLHVGALNRVDIDLPIRRGRQDLQALAEHINEKLDALVQMFESVDAIPMVRNLKYIPLFVYNAQPLMASIFPCNNQCLVHFAQFLLCRVCCAAIIEFTMENRIPEVDGNMLQEQQHTTALMNAVVQVRVVLDTPFALLSSAPKSIAEPVLQVVSFAPELEALAGQALAAMYSRTGGEVFNGVHLRVEPDARKMRQWRAGAAAVEVLLPSLSLVSC